jgi:hypothetical protein
VGVYVLAAGGVVEDEWFLYGNQYEAQSCGTIWTYNLRHHLEVAYWTVTASGLADGLQFDLEFE